MTQVQHGLYQFMALGIPAEKLVLGMDWGGAAWECMNYVGDSGLDYCEAELLTTLNGYRGVNCTDDVSNGCDNLYHCWQMLTAPTTVHHGWDDYVKLPYFNFAPKNSSKLFQMWYESPESIGHKVSMAKQMQIGACDGWAVGVGDGGCAGTRRRIQPVHELASYECRQMQLLRNLNCSGSFAGGVGPWELGKLNYSHPEQVKDVWSQFCKFFGNLCLI